MYGELRVRGLRWLVRVIHLRHQSDQTSKRRQGQHIHSSSYIQPPPPHTDPHHTTTALSPHNTSTTMSNPVPAYNPSYTQPHLLTEDQIPRTQQQIQQTLDPLSGHPGHLSPEQDAKLREFRLMLVQAGLCPEDREIENPSQSTDPRVNPGPGYNRSVVRTWLCTVRGADNHLSVYLHNCDVVFSLLTRLRPPVNPPHATPPPTSPDSHLNLLSPTSLFRPDYPRSQVRRRHPPPFPPSAQIRPRARQGHVAGERGVEGQVWDG